MDYIRRMRDLREDADLTQAQVAAKLGTPAMSAAQMNCRSTILLNCANCITFPAIIS